MNYAPYARIFVRYVVGAIIGADAANVIAADPDLITIIALMIGASVEVIYDVAKRKGWST